jgi:hypothetical protein
MEWIIGLFATTQGASLLGTLLSSLFKSLFDGMFGYLDKRANDQAHEELGKSKVIATINKENSDAQRRAAKVAADAPSLVDFLDLMERGDVAF